jgi:hypothetical protein
MRAADRIRLALMIAWLIVMGLVCWSFKDVLFGINYH